MKSFHLKSVLFHRGRKILTLISIALLIHSCCLFPVEKEGSNQYAIQNNTSHFIIIQYSFKPDFDSQEIKKDTIRIEPNTEYLEYKMSGYHFEAQGIFPITTDSVVINFDNKREIIQTCEHFFSDDCTIERNIVGYWNAANYTKKVIGRECTDKEYRYTYTITEEDYNNAVPIEE